MTQAGPAHFEYDLDSNMTLRVEISGTQPITCVQEFDVENRLTQVTNLPVYQVTSYGYDGDGNLAWREAGGEMELYIGEAVVVRGLSELPQPPPPTSHTIHLPLVARNASGSPPPAPSFQAAPFEGERYYRLGGAIVGWRVGSSAESVVYWLHGDHLGSIVRVTNESGEQVLSRGYDAWGEMAWATGTLTLTLPLGYTGQMYDAETGLLYLHARWYYPSLGRFVSADTVVPDPGNSQDLNRYAYAANNPLRYVDPTGHWYGPDDYDPAGIETLEERYAFAEMSGDESVLRWYPTGEIGWRGPGDLPPSPPTPIGAQWLGNLWEKEPDYRGVSGEIGVPTLVMLTGLGFSEVGLPQVGLPTALVGAILDLNPVTGPTAIGGAFEWDEYGHHYGSVQASWGHAWPAVPVAVNVYGVRIFTEGNCPATEQEVTKFVPGLSVNAGGSVLYGGGLVWNPDFGSAFPGTTGLQTGWAFPIQAGISIGYALQID